MSTAETAVSTRSAHAATTLIRARPFASGASRRITISTSWSRAVKRFIKRSTEKTRQLVATKRRNSGEGSKVELIDNG